MRNQAILASSAIAVIVVGVVIARDHVPATSAAAASSPTPGGLVTRPPELTGTVAASTRRIYDVAATFDVELIAPSGREQSLRVHVTGTWQLDVIVSTAAGTTLRSELAVRANTSELQQELARPHALVIAPDGAVRSFQFEATQGALARGIVRSLATTTQLVRRGAATSWQVQEHDAAGRYVAEYRADGARIGKAKVRYVAGNVESVSGTVTFELGDDGALTTVIADEVTTSKLTEVTARAHSQVSLKLRTSSIADTSLPEQLEHVAVDAPPLGSVDREHADRTLLAGATLSELLGELARTNEDNAATVASRLAALVRLQPTAAAELAKQVAPATSVQRGVLLGALGQAGTDEAQQALVGILQDQALATEARVHAGIATMLVEHPNANVIDALRAGLRSESTDVRATAGLALGALAGRLGDAALVDDLLAELAATREPQRMIELLGALGNARDTRALPAIRGALASSLPSVRRAAVTALRGMASADAHALVVRALVEDSDPLVRKAAAQAAAFLGLRGSLSTAISTEADAGVRAAIKEALAALD